MNFLLAPDSFKGSVSAKEVTEAVERGIRKVLPNANIFKMPMADGGEGTVETILSAVSGEKTYVKVRDPLGRTIEAFYGILPDTQTAVIEMATASGLVLLQKGEQNPLKTNTFGTGELINDAIRKGCKNIIICIGGSATNDGGAGMLQALGVKFYDKNNNLPEINGSNLSEIYRINATSLNQFAGIRFTVACDVTNPLLGNKGASMVFSHQKGATPEMAAMLEKNMTHFADITEKTLAVSYQNKAGAGAAGGLGFGLMAFLKADMKKGVEMVMEITGIEKVLQQLTDKPGSLVITGEGSIDSQTAFGKVPAGVAQLAKKYKLPVIVIAGSIGNGATDLYKKGIDAFFSITEKPMTLEEAMLNAGSLIENTAENIVRLWKVSNK